MNVYLFLYIAGALCQYKETARSRELLRDCGSYDEYTSALVRECNSGQPATLVFTPDETTPDTVYYQVHVYNMHGDYSRGFQPALLYGKAVFSMHDIVASLFCC